MHFQYLIPSVIQVDSTFHRLPKVELVTFDGARSKSKQLTVLKEKRIIPVTSRFDEFQQHV